MNETLATLPAPVPSSHHYALIMAGGKGERFWPMSTARRPKQLLALAGGAPLICQAISRLEGLVPPERIVVVTNRSLVEPIRKLLPAGSPVGILGEPIGRDTAAAIAAGGAWIRHRDPEATFCVLTADHVIGDVPLFQATLAQSLALAAATPALLTIGIEPTEASSAYGYIALGELYAEAGPLQFYRSGGFREKPDKVTAEKYLAEGNVLWNSGMFTWSLESLLAAYRKSAPHLAERLLAWSAEADDEALLAAMDRDFPALPKISIDYAVMEHADNIIVCRGRFPWDDVGSWPALDAHLPHDEAGNATLGDVVAEDAQANIVLSEGRLTALVGVRDLVVVQTPEVTLVCPKARSQDIKALLAKLRAQPGREGIL
ncbi:MAG: mannose-1-phosphate guanylyltransferase [Kiritimatiellae bacterium]|nr:mannose-1-phosphate guanylyltransferase [Kiritimatiellia bacterium]